MKKLFSVILIMLMIWNALPAFASVDIVLLPKDVSKTTVPVNENEIREFVHKRYFMFSDVDLTGIKSITAKGWVDTRNSANNGETLVIIADDYKTGEILGYITLYKDGENIEAKTSVKPMEGKHDLYFYCLYGSDTWNYMAINEIVLSKDEYVNPKKDKMVPDSAVKDVFADTWAATDDYGRAVADYAEAGDVKTDGREVGMLYWDWHIDEGPHTKAVVIPEIIKNNPDAFGNYNHQAWEQLANYYWSEPVLGFYDSYDYWVYRKHAEMLAIAGVDAIFFDYTNSGRNYIGPLTTLADAFRDSKRAGVKVPKISVFTSLDGSAWENIYRNTMGIYGICFIENDYSDIWYYLDGKPLIYGNGTPGRAMNATDKDNLNERNLVNEMTNFFSTRLNGGRNIYSQEKDGYWMWLENFPQVQRNKDNNTGRPEFMCVGTAVNQSTIYGDSITGVFSDPYSKGRGFSEVFGEDETIKGAKEGYFFREQASLALATEPEFIMIDGWNELTTVRYNKFGNFSGTVFVDTFDDENSRDFEPVRGPLKDDYYNMLCDFIRKYKGVRPVPTASGMKTIDILGDVSGWENVGPEYFNYDQDYERDSEGLGDINSDESIRYETTVTNAITGGKVTFDDDNFYFLVNAKRDIKTDGKGFMTLYINADRNKATGWEGYDYAVNLSGDKVLTKNVGNAYNWEAIGNVSYSVSGKSMQMAIERALIGETGVVDFEFKWTDSVENTGDILNFYSEGSVAPYGRFNYVFTEIPETTLSEDDRFSLSYFETSVLKAGSPYMNVKGGKMKVYEADTRVTPFERNETLYVPETAYNEIMGYGRSKTEYNSSYNLFFSYHFELDEAMQKVINNSFAASEVNGLSATVDGKEIALRNPVIYENGIFFIPLTYIEDCYGWTIEKWGDGAYSVGKDEGDGATIKKAIAQFN